MEEVKHSDLHIQSQNNSQPVSQVVHWFWQSGQEPWKDTDPNNWKWEAYPYEHSDHIEQAFSFSQKIVDIGNYEIDFKRMVQINKKDRSRIRRVQRQVDPDMQSRFMIELPKPLVIEKIQQTINPAFGTVQHFLNYLMKRTPEAYRLSHRLKDINLNMKQSEYGDIMEDVIKCIKNGAIARQKIVKARGLINSKNPMQEAHKIVSEIKSNSATNPDWKMRDFFKTILKVYTMESFICYWLNELLRSEDWEEINVLTPFLVCLTYAFQVKDYTIKYQEPQGLKEAVRDLFKPRRKLVLYRGAALSEEHLSNYDSEKKRLFSWNAVTSTSRSREQALRFIRFSMKKVQPGDKVGVLFRIEADFSSGEDCEGMIDISQDSKYPQEQEVILAPGTVFQVMSAKRNKSDNIYEIELRLVKKFNENHELLGDLQAKIISDDKAVFDNLGADEMIKALQLLEGNQIISKLKISNCRIDGYLMELIENMRITTNIVKEDIVLTSNAIVVDNLVTLCHYYDSKNLESICSENNIIFKVQDAQAKIESSSVKEISLEKSALKVLLDNGQIRKLWQKIKNEPQLKILSLEIKDLQISEKDLNTLISMERLAFLQSLSLDFELNKTLSNEILNNIQKAMENWKLLKHLSLSFVHCTGITSEGVKILQTGLTKCKQLISLSLNFMNCKRVSPDLLWEFNDQLLSLSSLRDLDLTYSGCSAILDEEVKSAKGMLVLPPSLRHLTINFRYCFQIEDKKLNILRNTLKSLTSICHLSLDFWGCYQITDKGLRSILDALIFLSSLMHLSLNFKGCRQISDQGLESLIDVLGLLKLLDHLALNFKGCEQISDEGLDGLKDALMELKSLEHLDLEFKGKQISDDGLNSLIYTLKQIKSLQHLSLDFRAGKKDSRYTLNKAKDILRFIPSLHVLHMDSSGLL